MSVFIDFAECKRVLNMRDVLEACDVDLAHYIERNGRLVGPCPLPSHPTNCGPGFAGRNKEQWVADKKKGYWLFHCWAPDCDKGGSVIDLSMLMNDLDDKHVRRWLADKFGHKIGTSKPQVKAVKSEGMNEPESTTEETVPVATPETAPPVQEAPVEKTKPLRPMRWKVTDLDYEDDYLIKRGVSAELARHFSLGVCHPKPGKKKRWLDDYVAVPLHSPTQSLQESPCGYYARLASFDQSDPRDKHKLPPGFAKTEVLFGWQQAMEAVNDRIFVVEGVFDLLALVSAGFKSVVCTLGGSLSPRQAELLIDTNRRVWLLYDGDDAGRTAMRSAIDLLVPAAEVKVVTLPDDQDPADILANQLADLLS